MSVISKPQYDELRARLAFQPSGVMNVLTLGVNAALLALSLWMIADGGRLQYVAAQLILPVVFFQGFAILHECGHGSFSRSRMLNSVVGHWVSLLCFMPFYPWKYIHALHHVWVGNVEQDPGLKLVKRARERGDVPAILELGWRTWIPIGGLLQHVVYWLHPVLASRSGQLSRERAWQCAFSVCLLPATYLVAHTLWPGVVSFSSFAPALLLYLALVEMVNLPHHVGLTSFSEKLPLWEQHQPTRSCNYPPVVSELVVLNFNFHIEHHLFPTLPWYRLRQARALIKPALVEAYRETTGLSWHLKHRKRRMLEVMTQRSDA